MSKNAKKKRIRPKVGDIIKIPLAEGEWGFGRVLESPVTGFYDLKARAIPPLEEIIAAPIAFKVVIMDYAITDGDFPVIGNLPLSDELLEKTVFFIQDQMNGKLSLTYDGGETWPATYEDAQRLECAAVWEPEHIVDRLNDHFAGRPNKWAESLKPKQIIM